MIQDGVVLQKSGYGMADIERGLPFETDTSVRLASVSKQFTAMAIMMLEEEGRLDYDDGLPALTGAGLELVYAALNRLGCPDQTQG